MGIENAWRNCDVWWYWIWKKTNSPIQELNFNKILINVSTDRLIVSSKVQFDEKGFKYFIRYKIDFAKIFPCV